MAAERSASAAQWETRANGDAAIDVRAGFVIGTQSPASGHPASASFAVAR